MQLGNWSSAPHQLIMGLSQGSPLSSILFNVDTKGRAELNQNGPSKILTMADNELVHEQQATPRRQQSSATTG